MKQLPDEKELLELMEMAKIVEQQMIEIGQAIAAVDEKSAKRIGEFREAKELKQKISVL